LVFRHFPATVGEGPALQHRPAAQRRDLRAIKQRIIVSYVEFSPVIDTVLVVALACIVWAAYRKIRSRQLRSDTRKEA